MVTLLMVLGSLLAGQVDAAGSELLQADVRRLVRQLDGDSLAEREAAEKALVELGPNVLDLLPPVSRNTSAEVKVRLDRIRKTLQEKAAQAAAEATRVTLKGEMPLSEALAALAKQSGNKIVDFRERFGQQAPDPAVKADFQEVPFWNALDDLLDQAGLTVYNFSGEPGTVAIVSRGSSELSRADRATYSGLFRFEGISLIARRDLRDPDSDSLRLTLEVAWEPRVSPIVLQLPLESIQAVDENGQTIPVDTGPAQLEIPAEMGIPATEIQVPLKLPDRQSRKIASLQGRLQALVPGRVQEFTFEDLKDAKAVEQRAAGVTVTLEQVRKNLDLYEARVRVRFDQASNALESHRNWVYNNEAYLLDPEGERVDHAGMQATLQRDDEVGVAYLFDREQGIEGCKFVYKTPVVIVSMPVGYQLKDIPLP